MYFTSEKNTFVFLAKNRIAETSLVRELSVLQKHLCAPTSRCDRKDLERVPIRAKVWLDPNEFVHDGSVKHPYTFFYPHTAAHTKRPDVQTGGRHAPRQNASGGRGLGGQY